MPKVSKLCTEKVYNLHVTAFKYSLPDLQLIFIHHTVKYQQSLTHTLSLDEIRHRQLPRFYIHNRHQSF